MKRLRKAANLAFLVVALGASAMQDAGAQDGSESLRVEGDAASVHLDVHKTTIGDVLAALADSFDISYSSKISLTETRDGTYQGSLRQVIARMLDGYDFAIRQQKSKLDVMVFEKVGGQAVPAPQQHPVSQHRAQLQRAAQE
jgi:hypothetical protein